MQQPWKWRPPTIRNGGRLGKKLWVSVIAVVVGGEVGGLCGSCVVLAVSLLLWLSRYRCWSISGWGR
eukprot:1322579-Ditylum_brightwellii.AAC.1